MVSLFEEHIFNPSTPKEKEKRRFDHTGHENGE